MVNVIGAFAVRSEYPSNVQRLHFSESSTISANVRDRSKRRAEIYSGEHSHRFELKVRLTGRLVEFINLGRPVGKIKLQKIFASGGHCYRRCTNEPEYAVFEALQHARIICNFRLCDQTICVTEDLACRFCRIFDNQRAVDIGIA